MNQILHAAPTIQCLPNEILVNIFDHLNFSDHITVTGVCRRWRRVADWNIASRQKNFSGKDTITIGSKTKWNLRFVAKYLAKDIRNICFMVCGDKQVRLNKDASEVTKRIAKRDLPERRTDRLTDGQTLT